MQSPYRFRRWLLRRLLPYRWWHWYITRLSARRTLTPLTPPRDLVSEAQQVVDKLHKNLDSIAEMARRAKERQAGDPRQLALAEDKRAVQDYAIRAYEEYKKWHRQAEVNKQVDEYVDKLEQSVICKSCGRARCRCRIRAETQKLLDQCVCVTCGKPGMHTHAVKETS